MKRNLCWQLSVREYLSKIITSDGYMLSQKQHVAVYQIINYGLVDGNEQKNVGRVWICLTIIMSIDNCFSHIFKLFNYITIFRQTNLVKSILDKNANMI